jgi:hypothetical protein
VSEWLMVPLSKSGVREHRGFESLPLRQARTSWTAHRCVVASAPDLTHVRVRSVGCSAPPSAGLVPEARDCVAAHVPEGRELLRSGVTRACLRRGPTSAGALAKTWRQRVDPGTIRQHASRRGRLVDYGAALEMRFGATRRGFESLPLRHTPPVGHSPSDRPDSHQIAIRSLVSRGRRRWIGVPPACPPGLRSARQFPRRRLGRIRPFAWIPSTWPLGGDRGPFTQRPRRAIRADGVDSIERRGRGARVSRLSTPTRRTPRAPR